LEEGKSPAQIINEAERRREQLLLRQLPASKVNGGAAAHDLVSFAEAARQKELALARLRQVELAQKTGEMIETATVRAWMNHLLRPVADALRALPGQMASEFDEETGRRLEIILGAKIENILQALLLYLDDCARRGCAPIADGGLRSGDYQVEWSIKPVPKVPPENDAD
jgi:hypothetical protein